MVTKIIPTWLYDYLYLLILNSSTNNIESRSDNGIYFSRQDYKSKKMRKFEKLDNNIYKKIE